MPQEIPQCTLSLASRKSSLVVCAESQILQSCLFRYGGSSFEGHAQHGRDVDESSSVSLAVDRLGHFQKLLLAECVSQSFCHQPTSSCALLDTWLRVLGVV